MIQLGGGNQGQYNSFWEGSDDRDPLLAEASHWPAGGLGSKFPESWGRLSECLLALSEEERGFSGVPPGGGYLPSRRSVRVTGRGKAVSFTCETGITCKPSSALAVRSDQT